MREITACDARRSLLACTLLEDWIKLTGTNPVDCMD